MAKLIVTINITQAVEKAAFEVLGRKKKFRKKKGLKVWSTEIEEAIGKRQETYKRCLNNPAEYNYQVCKHQRRVVKEISRRANKESWDRFTSNIENDIRGRQNLAYKVMKDLNNQVNDSGLINNINERKWPEHYQQLWYDENAEETMIKEVDVTGLDDIDLTELTEVLKATKTEK